MRFALATSLLLLTCICCAAGPYTDLKHKLDYAKSDADVIRAVKASQAVASQEDIRSSLARDDVNDAEVAKTLRAQIDLRAMAESRSPVSSTEQQKVSAIKNSPFYKDPGIDQKRNWLSDALERIRNIRFNMDPPKMQGSAAPGFGGIFILIVWFLLAAGVLFLLYFAIRHVQWQRTLRRKVKTLLEEDEPDRTLDEWLVLADEHAAAGRFREAVRALYLACLLKFDAADVARFDRGETNWEHLERIEESPNLPSGLDFRTPTRRFDRIWYGYQTEGNPDFELFRGWYRGVAEALEGVPA